MALFKIFKGSDTAKITNSSATGYMVPTDGYAYYDTSSKLFYIDAAYDGTVISRQPINADNAVNGMFYGTCATAQSTKAKIAILTNSKGFTLKEGIIILIKFTNASAASTMTLAIQDNKGNTIGAAKNLYQYGTTLMSSGTTNTGWAAGALVPFVYNGTGWERFYWANTLNTAGSTDTTSKIFLIGATSQGANPQTYSDSEIYVTNGTLYAVKTTEASGTANNKPALIVGGTDTTAHLELDANELMAKSNGTTTTALYLNNDGGLVYANNKKVVRLTSDSEDGQIMIADGADGQIKSSGYTIVNTVPSASSTSATIPSSTAIWAAISGASGYGKTGTVTSVQVQATAPIVSSSSASASTSLSTTISLAATSANYIIAGPSSGTATAVPTYRKLVAADIPTSLQENSISGIAQGGASNISFNEEALIMQNDQLQADYYSTVKLNSSYATLEIEGKSSNDDPGSYVCAYTDHVKIGLQDDSGGNLEVTDAGSWMHYSDNNTTSEIYVSDDGGAFIESTGNIGLSATNSINISSSNIDFNNSNLKITKISAPISSNSTTYTNGNAGDILISNGSKVYWGNSLSLTSLSLQNSNSYLGISPGGFDADPSFLNINENYVELLHQNEGDISIRLDDDGLQINDGTGLGSNGQALLSNGSKAYWGNISDTKNTAGSTNSTSKTYLIGALEQSANPQTYSHTAIYATEGVMAATSYKVAEAVTLVYDATNQALNFVFA